MRLVDTILFIRQFVKKICNQFIDVLFYMFIYTVYTKM